MINTNPYTAVTWLEIRHLSSIGRLTKKLDLEFTDLASQKRIDCTKLNS